MTIKYEPSVPTMNKAIADADLVDIIRESLRRFSLNLNCHAIAEIVSFDATNQSATVKINYQKTYFQRRGSNGPYQEKVENYSPIINVPVIVLGGAGAHLTFPIASGDHCVLLFNDRDMDIWLMSGQTTPPNTDRLHSLADAIALVGLNSFNAPIASYDTARAVLRNGTAKVGVNTNAIQIANSSYNLKTELTNLCTQLNNLTTALATLTVQGVVVGGGVSGVPVNAATITSIGSNISTISSHLGSLLE